jgi:hypothetical protein
MKIKSFILVFIINNIKSFIIISLLYSSIISLYSSNNGLFDQFNKKNEHREYNPIVKTIGGIGGTLSTIPMMDETFNTPFFDTAIPLLGLFVFGNLLEKAYYYIRTGGSFPIKKNKFPLFAVVFTATIALIKPTYNISNIRNVSSTTASPAQAIKETYEWTQRLKQLGYSDTEISNEIEKLEPNKKK